MEPGRRKLKNTGWAGGGNLRELDIMKEEGFKETGSSPEC